MNMLNEPGFTTSETTSPSSLLTNNLSLLSGAPNGIQKLRVLILELAVRGKLVPQDPNDEPARELLERIARGKKQLSTKEHSKKQKELTKSDEKPLFELPDGWVWARLGTLISEAYTGLDKGKSLQGSEYKYPYFKMNNILNKGGYDVSTMTRVNASDEEVKKYKLYPGDLLFNTRNSRELVGKSCVIQSLPEEIVLYNNNILRCNFFEGISAEVLDYWLRSSTGSQLLNLIKSNTTNVCAIYQGNLFELVCPVIPFKEQTRIVAKVNELMALCDRLEAQQTDAESAHARLVQALLDSLTQASDADDFAASWQRLAEHFHTLFTTESSIDALKQTLLQLAVMGKLVPQDPSDEPAAELLKHIAKEKSWLVAEGKSRKQKSLAEISDDEKLFKLPNGWEWSRLGSQVIDSGAGWSPSCEPRPREGKEWGVLKVSAVSWGAYKPEENKALPENLEARPEHEVLEGDFLVSRANTAELVARSVVVETTPKRLMLSDKIVRLKLSNKCDPRYINLANSTPFARQYYARVAGGTSSSMKNVSREQILNLQIALPPLSEQHRIVAKFDQLMALCDKLKTRLNQSHQMQEYLANALVEQAVA